MCLPSIQRFSTFERSCRRLLVVVGACSLIGALPTLVYGDEIGKLEPRVKSLHEKAMDCVCRVVLEPNHGGTGFVFFNDGVDLWIMTAGHIVNRTNACDLYFYASHDAIGPLRGRIVAVSYNHAEQNGDSDVKDVALVCVPVSRFEIDTLPPAAKLAPPKTRLKSRDVIFSVGCPNLKWPTSWYGRAVIVEERSFWFKPNPMPGRSGSPIFDREGRHVLGMIIWSGPIYGRAVTSDELYKILVSRNLVQLTAARS